MTKRKRFLLILTFVIFQILVWFVSLTFVAEANSLIVGFVLTACGITVLVVYVLVSRLTPPAAGQKPSAEAPPASTPNPQARIEEDEVVASILREANDRLAKSPTMANQRVKSAVSDFPLYLIVGPGEAGKTSLLLASKLDVEPLAGQVNRDSMIIPTRVGNVWFAEGAVLAEAGGDRFSGDPDGWLRLVQGLCRPRGQSRVGRWLAPAHETKLKGVVLCLDLTPFAGEPKTGVPDSARLAAMSRLVQQRLRAIAEMLGHDFPVYAVFTKADKLKYFDNYFRRLKDSEDQQILGCTLPARTDTAGVFAEAESARLSSALNNLYLSLTEKRLTFLARETDAALKPAIYEFPRELKKIRATLVQFLVDVFRPNQLQPNPVLEGFYFTGTRSVPAGVSGNSGPQPDESVIVTRVGDVTRMFKRDEVEKLRAAAQMTSSREKAAPEREVMRWAFTSDLCRQIVKSGRSTAGGYVNRKQQLYRKIAYISAVGLSAIGLGFFSVSYFENRALLKDVEAAAVNSSVQNLPLLEMLRTKVELLTRYRETHPPLPMRFGLYSGGEALEPAETLYYARFKQYFLDGIVANLVQSMAALPSQQNPAHPFGYSDLQIYRTISTTSRERACPSDAGLAEKLYQAWRPGRALNEQDEKIAQANFAFYTGLLMKGKVPEVLNIASKDDMVGRAREYLKVFKGAEPQYRRIIDQVNQQLRGKARLIDVTHNDDSYRSVLRVDEEVPGAFTRAGWDNVEDLINRAATGDRSDDCVLGKTSLRDTIAAAGNLQAGTELKAQLRQMYIKEYVERWNDFLNHASVRPFTRGRCAEGAEKLKQLQKNTSPILAVLFMTADNTAFPKRAPSLGQQTAQLAQTAAKGQIAERIRQMWPGRTGVDPPKLDGNKPANAVTEDAIAAEFQPARMVFETLDPMRWNDTRNGAYLNALSELQRAIEDLSNGEKSGKCDEADLQLNSQATAKLRNAQGAVDGLYRNFSNVAANKSVESLLRGPLWETAKLINTDPSAPAKAKVNEAQSAFCAALNPLKNKYPFARTAEDADLAQIVRTFSPERGAFAKLLQAVDEDVDRQGDSFAPKQGAPVPLSPAFVTFLTRMSEIARALFRGGTPESHFKLAVQENSGIIGITDLVNGLEFSTTEREYTWPAAKPDIYLISKLKAGGRSPFRSFSGVWGIFRLMSDADRTELPNQFIFVNVQGGAGNPQPVVLDAPPVVFEVRQAPNGVARAFERNFFRIGNCPSKAAE